MINSSLIKMTLAYATSAMLLCTTLWLPSGAEKCRDSADSFAVEIGQTQRNSIDYVQGKIRIERSPERVWPILSNPFEFEQSIAKRFHTTDVLIDRPDISLMKCVLQPGFLMASINYTVESRYQHAKRITFQSKAGDLKDFRGYWELEPIDNGKASLVTYAMHLETGLPVPQWIVRQGIKLELPKTLKALRDRVGEIYSGRGLPPARRALSSTGELSLAVVSFFLKSFRPANFSG